MKKEIEFIHFGETCNPIIIINFILKLNKKTLFQLGVYPFNTIVKILEDSTFENITDIDYIRYNNNKLNYLEDDKIDNYMHNSHITNIKYDGLTLVHDFGVEENTIINYNFIKKMHNIKIQNFYNSINSKKVICFICFISMSNFLDLEYEKLIIILKQQYYIEDFIIIIFTNDKLPSSLNLPKEYEFVTIDCDYRGDVHMSYENRCNAYKEIWEKFRIVMTKYNYNYLSFEDVFDGKFDGV